MPLDVLVGQALAVQRQDAVIEPLAQGGLPLGDQLRFEGAVSVAGHLNAHRSMGRPDGLTLTAITPVGTILFYMCLHLTWTQPSGMPGRPTGKTDVRRDVPSRECVGQRWCFADQRRGTDPPQGVYNLAGGRRSFQKQRRVLWVLRDTDESFGRSMSSTFWLKTPNHKVGCETVQQELDIVEAIGGAKKFAAFKHKMKSNAHIFRTDCDGNRLPTLSTPGETRPDCPRRQPVPHLRMLVERCEHAGFLLQPAICLHNPPRYDTE